MVKTQANPARVLIINDDAFELATMSASLSALSVLTLPAELLRLQRGETVNLSRRRFLAGTAVGALVLGFGLPMGSARVQAAAAAAATAERGTQVPAFLEIRPDGTIAPWLTLERHLAILEALYGHQPSTRYALITVPTLLVPADSGEVAWTTDKRVAVDTALELLPNGRAHWFAPAHHDIHAQHPVRLAEVLVQFAEEAVPG